MPSLWTCEQLFSALEATVQPTTAEIATPYRQVVIDSRAVQAGDIFVAIHGEQVDGHDFIEQAIARGAKGIVVHQSISEYPKSVLCAQVADTQAALLLAARAWRSAYEGPVLAVTGSMGKTTTRDMAAAIARAAGYHVLVSNKNYNSEIGLPLVLLNATETPNMVILEMGAKHANDIQILCEAAQPTAGVITNVANAHVAIFGDFETLVHGKTALYRHLQLKDDAAIALNQDEPRLYGPWQTAFKRCVTFSLATKSADFFVTDIQCFDTYTRAKVHTPEGVFSAQLPLIGAHQWQNALAAMALMWTQNIDIHTQIQGLKQVSVPAQRAQCHRWSHGLMVYDDTYNAIDGAVKAAIDFLATRHGHQWLILADLAELGDQSMAVHAELGRYASEAKIDRLWTCGIDSQFAHAAFKGQDKRHFSSLQSLKQAFREEVMKSTGYCWLKGANHWQLGQQLLQLMEPDTLITAF